MSPSVGLPVLGQQRRRGHDLARLAVAALDDVELLPGGPHGVADLAAQALDRDDLAAGCALDRQLAGARRDAVDVHGAGAALGDAAAVLGADQAELVAQHPEQRGVGLGVDLDGPGR